MAKKKAPQVNKVMVEDAKTISRKLENLPYEQLIYVAGAVSALSALSAYPSPTTRPT